MREIPGVKPSMGAREGSVGEGGAERLEREREKKKKKKEQENAEITRRRAES